MKLVLLLRTSIIYAFARLPSLEFHNHRQALDPVSELGLVA